MIDKINTLSSKSIENNTAVAQPFQRLADGAEYKGSAYANAVRVERGISLEHALEIANNDPNIEYFFYVKGGSMVLELPPEVDINTIKDPLELLVYTSFKYDNGQNGRGYARVFHHGDTVFFTKAEERWLGSAPDLADVYLRS